MAYTIGAGAIWAVAGYTAVEFAQFVWVGRKLRDETQRYDSITLLDWFESRFDDRRHLVRVVGATIIAIFTTAYVAAQLNGGAKTLAAAFGIGTGAALLASLVLILVYMVLGGYIAVAYNDVVRAVIMLVGLIVLPVWGIAGVGGFAALAEALIPAGSRFLDPTALGLGAFLGFVGIGLGSPGQPHIVVRYMSIRDPRQLVSAAVIGTTWNVLLGLGAVLVGLVGRAATPGVGSLPDKDPETIYLVLASSTFGPALYGLLVGGVFAAILSTADSQLLVVASTLVRDLYEKVLRERHAISEATRLRLSRAVVIGAGVLAAALAYSAQELVFWLVLFAWGGLGASLGPALILSLYWRRTSRAGVVTGMISGTVVTIVWRLWLKDATGLYELIPAFFAASIAIVAVSLLFPVRDERRADVGSAP
jgi:sodium/proline symporter